MMLSGFCFFNELSFLSDDLKTKIIDIRIFTKTFSHINKRSTIPQGKSKKKIFLQSVKLESRYSIGNAEQSNAFRHNQVLFFFNVL